MRTSSAYGFMVRCIENQWSIYLKVKRNEILLKFVEIFFINCTRLKTVVTV